jgi:hypothetical protein
MKLVISKLVCKATSRFAAIAGASPGVRSLLAVSNVRKRPHLQVGLPTDRLTDEAVKLFADAFDKLLAAIGKRSA